MRNVRQRIMNHVLIFFSFFPPSVTQLKSRVVLLKEMLLNLAAVTSIKVICSLCCGVAVYLSNLLQRMPTILTVTAESFLRSSALHFQVLGLMYLHPYIRIPFFIVQLEWTFQRSCCWEANTADCKTESSTFLKNLSKQCIERHFKGERDSCVYM